ncbi:MAG: hypothetical protein QXH24_02700 [Candidatus Bathyarchaeia archaeon]
MKKEIGKIIEITQYVWTCIIPEGNIRIGLTDYAAKHLKNIVYVITEPIGKDVRKMEPIGVVETWASIFNIYALVSGKIIKVN